MLLAITSSSKVILDILNAALILLLIVIEHKLLDEISVSSVSDARRMGIVKAVICYSPAFISGEPRRHVDNEI